MRTLIVAALLIAVPAAAQDVALTKRVDTLETQMKGVQRKVFPGGDPRFFTPEIAPEAAPASAPEGSPATSAVADLTARVDALEGQQRTLTGAVEEAQFKLRKLDEAFTKYRGDTDFRLNAIEHPGGGAPVIPPVDTPPVAATPSTPRRSSSSTPAVVPSASAAPTASVEDQWRSAYALYLAKDYSHAEAAMTAFLTANPTSARASNAQYWLGRSYMTDDSYAQAAKAFLAGYKTYPDGARAPDSLLWLGNALVELKKPREACQAYNELKASYGSKLSPALTTAAAKASKDAKCSA